MKRVCFGLVLICFAMTIIESRAAEVEVPTIATILERVLKRAAQMRDVERSYECLRVLLTEELNDEGEVKQRREKRKRGPVRANTDDSNSEARDRPARGASRAARRKASADIHLDEALVARFSFQLERSEKRSGRLAYLLTFEPRRNQPVRTLEDRIINQVTGRVWIDAEDFDVIRLEMGLRRRVSVGWGILGALQHFECAVDRVRLADGSWLNETTDGLVEYRQIFSEKKVRWHERLSDFRKLTAK